MFAHWSDIGKDWELPLSPALVTVTPTTGKEPSPATTTWTRSTYPLNDIPVIIEAASPSEGN